MLYFNSCPRCKTGTVQLESDFYGSYLSCLNCGFEKSAASVRKLDYEEARRDAEAAVAVVVGDNAAPAAVAVDEEPLEEDELFPDDFDADEDELAELERAAG